MELCSLGRVEESIEVLDLLKLLLLKCSKFSKLAKLVKQYRRTAINFSLSSRPSLKHLCSGNWGLERHVSNARPRFRDFHAEPCLEVVLLDKFFEFASEIELR